MKRLYVYGLVVSMVFVGLTSPAFGGILDEKEGYYKSKVTSLRRTKSQIGTVDFTRFRRDYSDDVFFTFKKIDFIPEWGGGDFNDDYCTRYELAYFTGRLWRVMTEAFGLGFRLRPAGPRSYDIRVCDWGQEDVRIAIRSGLFNYHSSKEWWTKPVSRGTFIKYIGRIVRELKAFTPVIEFPLPFPPPERDIQVPSAVDPRYELIEYVYRTGLDSCRGPDGSWDVRQWLSKRSLAETMDRLIYIIHGYRDPAAPVKPQGEYPVHKKF